MVEANQGVTLGELSHVPRKVGATVQSRINALAVGQKMQDLPEHLWHESFRFYVKEDPTRRGGPNLRMIRLDPNRPSLTVTGFVFNKFVHPYEDRFITPREAARLQGFPDNFLFSGCLTSVQRQVGNAVPVQIGEAVGRAILSHMHAHNHLGAPHSMALDGELHVISLFSGAGGLDLGIESPRVLESKFSSCIFVENDEDCCATLRRNFGPSLVILRRDIRNVTAADLVCGDNIAAGALSIVIGGPPCQSFSHAGKQRSTRDARGLLVFEFLRVVSEVMPAYFVMENVKNLKSIEHGRLLAEIERRAEQAGYNTATYVLCAADYGAAQLRHRLIVIGVRKPYPPVPAPEPTHVPPGGSLLGGQPYVTVREAFAGLPDVAVETEGG